MVKIVGSFSRHLPNTFQGKEKNSITKAIMLITCFNFLAEVVYMGALPVELYLTFVMVRAAFYSDHQLGSCIIRPNIF